jgi:hypothetical protein
MFCCLLPAIGLLLAYRASDARRSASERARAAELLEAMGPRMAITAGLAADWGSECRSLIGVFDQSYHDPAKSLAEVDEWISKSKLLFGSGHILGASAGRDKTMTAVAVEGLMGAPPPGVWAWS